MSAEAAFVLALARGDGPQVERLLSDHPDPDRIADLAVAHNVDALCYWMWNNAIASTVRPPQLAEAFERLLRQAYIHHSLRNQALLGDLAALNGELRGRGVRCLFAKGPWLALCAYPDPGTRAIGDIDLCVRESDYEPALEALAALKYLPHRALAGTGQRALRQAHYGRQIRFTAPGRRPVELHFRVVNVGPPAREEDWIWATAREIDIQGGPVSVPGSEAMVLHLLLHANQHGFAQLRLLHDIRWALEQDPPALTSALFGDAVARLRCSAAVYQALVLARDMADAPVSEAILERLRPSPMRQAASRAAWRLSAVRSLQTRPGPHRLESPMLYVLEMGRLRDKLGFLCGVWSWAATGRLYAARPGPLAAQRVAAAVSEPVEPGPFRPRRRAHLICRRLDDSLAVYDVLEDRTTLLNHTAGAILELCDGSRTLDQLASELDAVFGVGKRRISADVERVLRDLGARGFVSAVPLS